MITTKTTTSIVPATQSEIGSFVRLSQEQCEDLLDCGGIGFENITRLEGLQWFIDKEVLAKALSDDLCSSGIDSVRIIFEPAEEAGVWEVVNDLIEVHTQLCIDFSCGGHNPFDDDDQCRCSSAGSCECGYYDPMNYIKLIHMSEHNTPSAVKYIAFEVSLNY